MHVAEAVAAAARSMRQGAVEEAVTALRNHLSANPDDAQAHLLIADALGRRSLLEDALTHAERAADLLPDQAQTQALRGTLLFRLGHGDAALDAFRRAIALLPNNPDGWANLGTTLLGLSRSGAAVEAFEKAVEIAPDRVAPHAQLGEAHLMAGNYGAAAQRFRTAALMNPGDSRLRIALADALRQGGQAAAAVDIVKQTIRDLGERARWLLLLGDVRVALGEFEAAAANFRAALDLDPREVNALLGLSRLGGGNDDTPLRSIETALGDEQRTEEDRIALLFARGNLLDRADEPAKAIQSFQEGNLLKRKTLHYKINAESKEFDRVKNAFSAELFAHRPEAGDPSGLPVFIVGMPRSGTTLVEQILGAHEQVHAGGELPYMRCLIEDWPDLLPGYPAYPAGVAALSAADRARLGERYVQKLHALAPEAQRITDKMPANFVRLGLIARILPRARIIHCRRDAMDVCASNFVTLYAGIAAPYAYDLVELAAYYRLYEGLMAHWRDVLPTPMIEVSYEALVANPEMEARRVLDFCGLDWDDRVLRFHERKGSVLSASGIQVRKPIYSASVGRWKRYGPALAPLARALGQSWHGF